MPANDALLGFCQKLWRERETMQPNLRVPRVLSTCKMEKTFFLTVYEPRILIFNHSGKTSTMHAFHSYETALQFTLLNIFIQPEMSTTRWFLLLKFWRQKNLKTSVWTFSPILKSSCLENNLNVLLLKFPEKWSKFCKTQRLSSPHC